MDSSVGLSKDQLVAMYRTMARIRKFEELVSRLFMQGRVRGSTHVYIGEEAVAVGICSALRHDDYITSTHRGHGHCIAKGGDPMRMVAELLGRATGYCKGLGGSMHIADMSLGILGANGIVGSGLPIATGAGLSVRLRGKDQVVACFFGDGAVNCGSFHESLNMAAVMKLPVVFVCENNLYALSTPISRTTAGPSIAARAGGYGIPGEIVDGNDVIAVYRAGAEAVDRARRGLGPTLVECRTYRHWGHMVGDPCVYRTKEEVDEWKKRDPIAGFAALIVAEGLERQADLEGIDAAAQSEMDEALKLAENSPEPDGSIMGESIFAPETYQESSQVRPEV